MMTSVLQILVIFVLVNVLECKEEISTSKKSLPEISEKNSSNSTDSRRDFIVSQTKNESIAEHSENKFRNKDELTPSSKNLNKRKVKFSRPSKIGKKQGGIVNNARRKFVRNPGEKVFAKRRLDTDSGRIASFLPPVSTHRKAPQYRGTNQGYVYNRKPAIRPLYLNNIPKIKRGNTNFAKINKEVKFLKKWHDKFGKLFSGNFSQNFENENLTLNGKNLNETQNIVKDGKPVFNFGNFSALHEVAAKLGVSSNEEQGDNHGALEDSKIYHKKLPISNSPGLTLALKSNNQNLRSSESRINHVSKNPDIFDGIKPSTGFMPVMPPTEAAMPAYRTQNSYRNSFLYRERSPNVPGRPVNSKVYMPKIRHSSNFNHKHNKTIETYETECIELRNRKEIEKCRKYFLKTKRVRPKIKVQGIFAKPAAPKTLHSMHNSSFIKYPTKQKLPTIFRHQVRQRSPYKVRRPITLNNPLVPQNLPPIYAKATPQDRRPHYIQTYNQLLRPNNYNKFPNRPLVPFTNVALMHNNNNKKLKQKKKSGPNEYLALSGAALAGGLIGYALYSSAKSVMASREDINPMKFVATRAKNGLNKLVSAIEKYEKSLYPEKMEGKESVKDDYSPLSHEVQKLGELYISKMEENNKNLSKLFSDFFHKMTHALDKKGLINQTKDGKIMMDGFNRYEDYNFPNANDTIELYLKHIFKYLEEKLVHEDNLGNIEGKTNSLSNGSTENNYPESRSEGFETSLKPHTIPEHITSFPLMFEIFEEEGKMITSGGIFSTYENSNVMNNSNSVEFWNIEPETTTGHFSLNTFSLTSTDEINKNILHISTSNLDASTDIPANATEISVNVAEELEKKALNQSRESSTRPSKTRINNKVLKEDVPLGISDLKNDTNVIKTIIVNNKEEIVPYELFKNITKSSSSSKTLNTGLYTENFEDEGHTNKTFKKVDLFGRRNMKKDENGNEILEEDFKKVIINNIEKFLKPIHNDHEDRMARGSESATDGAFTNQMPPFTDGVIIKNQIHVPILHRKYKTE